MVKSLTKVCGLEKLWLLKYANQKHMRCYPRTLSRVVMSKSLPADASPRERAFAPIVLSEQTVFCCGRKLGRHRRRGGRKKAVRWDWRRSYRSHASYRRRRG